MQRNWICRPNYIRLKFEKAEFNYTVRTLFIYIYNVSTKIFISKKIMIIVTTLMTRGCKAFLYIWNEGIS